MKRKRRVATFGKTIVLEKLIEYRGPLKESTIYIGTATDIGRPPTQDWYWWLQLRSNNYIWNKEAIIVYVN